LEKTLDGRGGDDVGTTRSRDKLDYFVSKTRCRHWLVFSQLTYSDSDGSTLSGTLDGQRVRLSKVGTPVTTTDWYDAELGNDDGGADGCSDFL